MTLNYFYSGFKDENNFKIHSISLKTYSKLKLFHFGWGFPTQREIWPWTVKHNSSMLQNQLKDKAAIVAIALYLVIIVKGFAFVSCRTETRAYGLYLPIPVRSES